MMSEPTEKAETPILLNLLLLFFLGLVLIPTNNSDYLKINMQRNYQFQVGIIH